MRKRLRPVVLLLLILPLSTLLICDAVIDRGAKGKTFYNLQSVHKNEVGIVLGTSSKLIAGGNNPYYTHRISATIALYKAGKIDRVLVSGDNATKYYNEPDTFKKDLIEGGIPEDSILLDPSGFRTLDSMVRAKEVFGLDSVTVISQKFQNERAVYLAEKKGLYAIGFNAQDLEGSQGLKVQVREYFARVKVFVDLLLNTQPRSNDS
ncbi:SanA/YdcF family protein [Muriicola soli]|uniref:Vancomycin high temperature exclusion protein n=1 Tax=Muriicola soli TaxID=2507538 RepID=A0A411E6M3_9FLAO|nr:ElyC/SanA/YdcF family protein [Muriicola soli]QBA63339.1 vancomycin high temperature exclusion protein [Muriicola soli]